MGQEFVTYKGKKYYVEAGVLDLREKRINDITEIKGLKSLTNLRELNLNASELEEDYFITEIKGLETLKNLEVLKFSFNEIEEIKGLEHHTNLKKLSLYDNRIEEIKGLEQCTNLKFLNLWRNPIQRKSERVLVDLTPQEIVRYCQEKARKNT